MKNETFKRHGDVIITKLSFTPDGEAAEKCVLALGEVTGHSHQIREGARFIPFVGANETHKRGFEEAYLAIEEAFLKEFPGEEFPFVKDDFVIEGFVIPDGVATLTHEEHSALTIDQPSAVIIQRNYSPEGWKKVID